MNPSTISPAWSDLTFLLVQWRQDAVVSAHLEIDLLLHAIRDGALGDNNTDSCFNGAQDASIGVEDASSCCDHRVAFVFILVIIQGARAEEEMTFLSLFHLQDDLTVLFHSGWVLPHRDGFGNCVNVIVLVLRAVLHSACECV